MPCFQQVNIDARYLPVWIHIYYYSTVVSYGYQHCTNNNFLKRKKEKKGTAKLLSFKRFNCRLVWFYLALKVDALILFLCNMVD